MWNTAYDDHIRRHDLDENFKHEKFLNSVISNLNEDKVCVYRFIRDRLCSYHDVI